MRGVVLALVGGGLLGLALCSLVDGDPKAAACGFLAAMAAFGGVVCLRGEP